MKLKPRNIAAIDMGSNAIRLAIGTLQADGTVKLKRKIRAPVRIGHDVFSKGTIEKITFKRVRKTFLKFKKILKKNDVKFVLAVTTSSVREATNREQFCKYVYEKTGISINVISGVTEARLILTAINNFLDISNREAVVMDIGGGSLELVYSKKGRIKDIQSFKIGSVRLLEEVIKEKKKVTNSNLKAAIGKHSKSVIDFFSRNETSPSQLLFLGTGGNFECLGRLRTLLLGKKSPNFVSRNELKTISFYLKNMSYHERIKKLKMRRDRADVILPSTMAISMVIETAQVSEFIVPFVGLSDGVLHHMGQTFFSKSKKRDSFRLSLSKC